MCNNFSTCDINTLAIYILYFTCRKNIYMYMYNICNIKFIILLYYILYYIILCYMCK